MWTSIFSAHRLLPADATVRRVARYGRALLVAPTQIARLTRGAERAEVDRIYSSISELSGRRWPITGTLDLRAGEFRVFSQNGEDGILAALIGALTPTIPFFVEFGVQTGEECNTRYLAEVLGWHGVYFEPDPQAFAALDRRYARTDRIRRSATSITPANVEACFASHGVPERFGVLSIDVDGQDYWIWEALPERFRPDIVVIEVNLGHPVGCALVEAPGTPWSWPCGPDYGASLEALRLLGERKGYRLVHVELSGTNAVFVRHDRIPPGLELIGLTDRSPNGHLRGRGGPEAGAPRPVIDVTRTGDQGPDRPAPSVASTSNDHSS